jgi:hypothetical protein
MMNRDDITIVSLHAILAALRTSLVNDGVIINRLHHMATPEVQRMAREMVLSQVPLHRQIDGVLAAIGEHVKAKDQSMPDFMPGASGGPQQ